MLFHLYGVPLLKNKNQNTDKDGDQFWVIWT